MGFDTDRFLSPVNDALTCCICRDVLEDPVQAPCEHAYCRSCIEAWLVHETTCPEDRRPLSISSLRPLFRYMRNDLNRLQLRCRNRAYGCEHDGVLEFMQSHESTCTFERLKCPNERCTFFAARRVVDDHVRCCEYSRKECPNGCGLLITRPAEADHNCIQELRTSLEVLRSELTCKHEEQKNELELRLDMQRNHMIQKESTLQSQIDALVLENSRLSQNIKFLMDMELSRRQEIESLELEKRELMELLRKSVGTSAGSEKVTRGSQLKRSNTIQGKISTV
ncbi:RING finger protein 151-like [Mya arenaria]|uniref:RING finger protein 151-like n=1 Tax=Mya arenaria TaxID=6604 RepID=UPI0022E6BEB5|nr:RING finger protein 151-like [Mya arenaria]XP_052817879.1 RING finger protein 151-like [Mya arenaria]XP_052817880.1 RING finger protein 151-like [Mya arenaria]XP_052817881.1 RING finger protein 151-like [Mya arenaria]XP_052817882.1 RING finger protein 151-like [Mya arenaria]